jgi:hypothetical protein
MNENTKLFIGFYCWLRLLVTTCPELVAGKPNNGSAWEDQREEKLTQNK